MSMGYQRHASGMFMTCLGNVTETHNQHVIRITATSCAGALLIPAMSTTCHEAKSRQTELACYCHVTDISHEFHTLLPAVLPFNITHARELLEAHQHLDPTPIRHPFASIKMQHDCYCLLLHGVWKWVRQVHRDAEWKHTCVHDVLKLPHVCTFGGACPALVTSGSCSAFQQQATSRGLTLYYY